MQGPSTGPVAPRRAATPARAPPHPLHSAHSVALLPVIFHPGQAPAAAQRRRFPAGRLWEAGGGEPPPDIPEGVKRGTSGPDPAGSPQPYAEGAALAQDGRARPQRAPATPPGRHAPAHGDSAAAPAQAVLLSHAAAGSPPQSHRRGREARTCRCFSAQRPERSAAAGERRCLGGSGWTRRPHPARGSCACDQPLCGAHVLSLPSSPGSRWPSGAPGAVEQRDEVRTLSGGGAGQGTPTLALHGSRGLAGRTREGASSCPCGNTRHDLWKVPAMGEVPGDWKKANATPLFKKSKEEELGNCWPDGFSSFPGKGMEHLTREAISRGVEGQKGDQESAWICKGRVKHPQPDHLLL